MKLIKRAHQIWGRSSDMTCSLWWITQSVLKNNSRSVTTKTSPRRFSIFERNEFIENKIHTLLIFTQLKLSLRLVEEMYRFYSSTGFSNIQKVCTSPFPWKKPLQNQLKHVVISPPSVWSNPCFQRRSGLSVDDLWFGGKCAPCQAANSGGLFQHCTGNQYLPN